MTLTTLHRSPSLHSTRREGAFRPHHWAYRCADLRRLIIAASNGKAHRILKIDRTDPTGLNVVEDPTTYTARELEQLLLMIKDGNKSSGGLEKVMDFQYVLIELPIKLVSSFPSGLIGFVKFTAGWYLIGIARRSVVGLLGGHYSELLAHSIGTWLIPSLSLR